MKTIKFQEIIECSNQQSIITGQAGFGIRTLTEGMDKEGGIAFGQNPKALYDITKAVKAKAKQPIMMKLSPNVTDITEMAKAAVDAGSDALSLINTLTGMKIDIEKRDFVLANNTKAANILTKQCMKIFIWTLLPVFDRASPSVKGGAYISCR